MLQIKRFRLSTLTVRLLGFAGLGLAASPLILPSLQAWAGRPKVHRQGVHISGTFTKLVDFSSTLPDSSTPKQGLFLATDGNLYGTTSAGGTKNKGTVFKLTGPSWNGPANNVINFDGKPKGAQPLARLFQAPDGNLYGNTFIGGTNNLGSIYKLSGSGFTTFTKLADLSYAVTIT